jgi:excisionase family DNA binding protein
MIELKEKFDSALLKRKEAAIYLNVSERWLQRYRAHGIPAVKLGKHTMFLITDLDSYIQRNRIAGVNK